MAQFVLEAVQVIASVGMVAAIGMLTLMVLPGVPDVH